jgi:hypothetical protein
LLGTLSLVIVEAELGGNLSHPLWLNLAFFRQGIRRPSVDPLSFQIQLAENLVHLCERSFLDFGPYLVSFIPLDVVQVVFVVLVADLAVGVVAIWYRLWDLTVVQSLHVKICLKLSLQVLFVFLLALFHNFVEFLGHKLKLSLAHAWTKSVGRVHLKFVQV